ncbi:MAG: YfcC family protein [Cytophagales bacterium]|nr:YfcC family protein [Cytophagales bacterium]
MPQRIPDTLVIISFVLVLFAVLTWIVPSGAYEREVVDGRQIVVKDSFHVVEQNPQGIAELLQAPIKGFADAAKIIAFVFFIGGVFGIISYTKAIDAGLIRLLIIVGKYPKYKLYIAPLLFILFAVTGATFGLSEEVLVFVLITVPLFISLGYDSILGIAIPLVGTAVGFGGAITNPFTVGIAQGIAELPLFSGWEYRLFCLIVLSLVSMTYLMYYIYKLTEDISQSPTYAIDRIKKRIAENEEPNEEKIQEFTFKRKLVLFVFSATIVLLVIGSTKWSWYVNEICSLFLGMSLIIAIIYQMSPNKFVECFVSGAKDLIPACMVIAFSKAIIILATEGHIMDTLLYTVSHALQGYHPLVSTEIMFLVQSLINIIVPSGSGQAALTMPILSPLSDVIGITRQLTVLIFQLGDGLNNMIIPTSGVTMGTLTLAKVPYNIWFKWAWPLMILLFTTAMILLIPPATIMYYGPR